MTNLGALGGICVLVVAGSSVADTKRYSLAELKALVQQKSFREALDHMDDVSPIDRNADWQDVLAQAAIATVADGVDDITKLQTLLVIEKQYPAVMKSTKYVALRTEIGPKGFEVCFKASYDGETCRNYALKFVDDDPTNGGLALAMAKIARRNMFAYGAVPFFKRALAAKAPVCRDDDFERAILAGLALPKDHALFADTRVLAGGACWVDLKKPILKLLADTETGYYKTNSCELLKVKNERVVACEDAK